MHGTAKQHPGSTTLNSVLRPGNSQPDCVHCNENARQYSTLISDNVSDFSLARSELHEPSCPSKSPDFTDLGSMSSKSLPKLTRRLNDLFEDVSQFM
ncbi:hypothetical protein KIN20_020402 [Parelaphostrongylus tenuis]|uniref:Uncharacterized protein n=1 Tax=Parelaphostrongylus tenuis TaxID=148309 RepID=A0AAD5MME2_PARTN|nr:hypothetical protein KIN20_020402 [Parelaphostrongylus tenuis]